MIWIMLIMLMPIILSSLAKFSNKVRSDISESVAEMVLASRLPSGVLAVEEMRAQNIFPYFCPAEDRVIWVENPKGKESCPWCQGSLFICS